MSQDQNENLESFNHMNILVNHLDAQNREEEIGNINIVVRNLNQNRRKTKRRKTAKREVSNNQSTQCKTNPRKRKREEKKKKKNPENRPDNIRRSAFIRLLIFLKIFFKKMFGLNFDSFNCQKDFGTSFGEFKVKMKWQIYQILCCRKNEKIEEYEVNEENKEKIKKLSETEMINRKRLMFFYFMTRTYEALYNYYIEGNINFPIIPKGTVRICRFITLQKVIEEKKKDEYLYINEFEELSKSMLADFETKERISTKDLKKIEKSKINLEKFESMKHYFDEFNVKAESNGLGLEEKNENETNEYYINNLDINKI